MRRSLHPAAWWIWGVLVGAAAVRITNPLLSVLLIVSIWVVVVARRRDVPWAHTYARFLRLGVAVIVIRLALQALFTPDVPGHVLFELPEADLPGWAAGVAVGGDVTAEGLLQALYEGLRLVGLLAALGAANSLADPYRLLRAVPTALYEAGVAVTVALSLVPQSGVAVTQVRDARRLRGRPTRGLAAVRGVAVPVLEGALERSVGMAASMDARGFGRRGDADPLRARRARWASALGLVALAVGTYGLLDAGAPEGLGVPVLLAGSALLAIGLTRSGRQVHRTRYRPDPWRLPEWLTAMSGAVVLGGILLAGRAGLALSTPVYPLTVPTLAVVPALLVLVAALPAVVTPEPQP